MPLPAPTRVLAALLFALAGCSSLPPAPAVAPTPSHAFADTGGTRIGRAAASLAAAHPGLNGVRALLEGREAFVGRYALALGAERSIDVQTYIWHADTSGHLLAETLWNAADRGVRVRVLLDDANTSGLDEIIAAMDVHPNIEVRLFNPFANRTWRLGDFAVDFDRVNRRMHNKAFIADNAVAIVGGRNIGDEYFSAHTDMNFSDLDVAAIGPVVREASSVFDLYWNSRAAIAITDLTKHRAKPEALAALRSSLAAHDEAKKDSAYANALRNCSLATGARNRAVSYEWGHAHMVFDHPDKVIAPTSDKTKHLAPALVAEAEATKKELFLVSPYFVPGESGVELFRRLRANGTRVVILTNSLASTDGIAVHAGYKDYRKPLLRAGVELYELKPTAKIEPERMKWRLGGSSSASMHSKTFAFDRQTLFVGSYNLDPRSRDLNTEHGFMIDCPVLARQMPVAVSRALITEAWRLELDGNQLVWVDQADGKEVRHHSEPQVSFWKRLKVSLIDLLPIVNQL